MGKEIGDKYQNNYFIKIPTKLRFIAVGSSAENIGTVF